MPTKRENSKSPRTLQKYSQVQMKHFFQGTRTYSNGVCTSWGGGGRYLFRRIIIYSIVWDFSCGLHRVLDPGRNWILYTRWSFHSHLDDKRHAWYREMLTGPELKHWPSRIRNYLYTWAMWNRRWAISIVRQKNLPNTKLILETVALDMSIGNYQLTNHMELQH